MRRVKVRHGRPLNVDRLRPAHDVRTLNEYIDRVAADDYLRRAVARDCDEPGGCTCPSGVHTCQRPEAA